MSQEKLRPVAGGAVALPFLWAWLWTRAAVVLGGGLPACLLAGGAAVLLVFPAVKFHLVGRFCMPWGMGWPTAVLAVAGFLLGGLLDVSYAMPNVAGDLLTHPLVRLLCHGGSGLVFAVLLLAVTAALGEGKGSDRVDRRQLLLLWAGVNALTLLFVLTSRTVYTWDAAGYWPIARQLAAEPFDFQHIRGILESTISSDYNHLLAFPISLVMRVLGGSRGVFLFCTANFYTFPAVWGLAALAKNKKWGGAALVGLLPMVVYVGLVGFVDTASCALAVWAYVVYRGERPAVSRGILTGALLVGSFLLRRYFFFFAASFGVAALGEKLLFDRKKWADFGALVASCALCTLDFTYVFLLEKVLGTDYGDLYSAYQMGLSTDFLFFCRYFGGIILLVLVGYGAVEALFGRERNRPVFALLQLVSCFVAFTLVQTHGQQHLLLYVPGLALLADGLLERIPKKGASLATVLVTAWCLVPKAQPATIQELSRPDIVPSFTFYGQRRSDIDQLLALDDFLEGLSAAEPHTVAVLSSSFTLNSDTLETLRPSLNLREFRHQTVRQYHGTVDKRDAFNWNTATADYLVVGDPVQVHLGEENQKILTLLVHDVLTGTGVGAAYEALPETFQLEKGCTVRIYRRVRDWTAEEYRDLSRALQAAYPDYAGLYDVPEWLRGVPSGEGF